MLFIDNFRQIICLFGIIIVFFAVYLTLRVISCLWVTVEKKSTCVLHRAKQFKNSCFVEWVKICHISRYICTISEKKWKIYFEMKVVHKSIEKGLGGSIGLIPVSFGVRTYLILCQKTRIFMLATCFWPRVNRAGPNFG